jgi:hypothetical protein
MLLLLLLTFFADSMVSNQHKNSTFLIHKLSFEVVEFNIASFFWICSGYSISNKKSKPLHPIVNISLSAPGSEIYWGRW